MRLKYAYKELSKLLADTDSDDASVITSIAIDTRRISVGSGVLFFALKGSFRDGHDFIHDAYNKGVRHFVVSDLNSIEHLEEAQAITVKDTYSSLWDLARHHRNQFNCPVVGITGSNGKTIVKEWLSQLLSTKYNVAKSPKSYNSLLGVPISLLEITDNTDIALIEVGVPEKGGMEKLADLIRPTHGIFTSFGTAHRSFFNSKEEHFQEKMILFKNLESFTCPASLELNVGSAKPVKEKDFQEELKECRFKNIDLQNLSLAVAMAKELGVSTIEIKKGIQKLRPVALRLETFDGLNDNLIINDTYGLDEDSLRLSLEYQLAHSNGRDRIVIVGLTSQDEITKERITELVESFKPTGLYFHDPADEDAQYSFSNSVILIKGSRTSRMEILASDLRKKMHQTYLEIDLKAIRNNINYHKSLLNSDTKILCMIKAASYGAGARRMGHFLQDLGADYLGVAYADEGMELRESGITLPILVMNCEENSFNQCLEYKLEPALYSMHQLDSFISFLIKHSALNFPVHLKMETGMNRLGFEESELDDLVNLIKGQPEIVVKSLYTHLATADEANSHYAIEQLARFEKMSIKVSNEFTYPIIKHALNSSGIRNYPDAQYDMVRLGIGMYGAGNQPELQPSLD